MKLLRISLTITFFLCFLLVSAQNHQKLRRDNSHPGSMHILNDLEKRNMSVALLIADQRMPEMEGTEYLEKGVVNESRVY